MISATKVAEIFCSIDDFCINFIPNFNKHLIGAKKRRRSTTLTLSEVMTIQVLFHMSRMREFKAFYNGHVCKHMRSYFPNLVSYNRMVELCRDSLIPLAVPERPGFG